jgi:hypothetical protein
MMHDGMGGMMWRIWLRPARGERRGVCVPAEMVEFIACVRHRDRMNNLSVLFGLWIDDDNSQGIGLREIRAQQQGVGECLNRLHGDLRGGVEGWIWPEGHRLYPNTIAALVSVTGAIFFHNEWHVARRRQYCRERRFACNDCRAAVGRAFGSKSAPVAPFIAGSNFYSPSRTDADFHVTRGSVSKV